MEDLCNAQDDYFRDKNAENLKILDGITSHAVWKPFGPKVGYIQTVVENSAMPICGYQMSLALFNPW